MNNLHINLHMSDMMNNHIFYDNTFCIFILVKLYFSESSNILNYNMGLLPLSCRIL